MLTNAAIAVFSLRPVASSPNAILWSASSRRSERCHAANAKPPGASVMILIGQYDSPFVRRVGVALHLYGMAWTHWPWSTFGDGDRLAAYNPLRRVPTLVLGDGAPGDEVLTESGAILDHLDQCAGPDRALVPPAGPARRAILRVCALATGACDKMVSLFYERALHDAASDLWIARCETQLGAVLDRLEAERAGGAGDWWFGDRIRHADIAVTCMMRFLGEVHPAVAARRSLPALTALAERCEALDAFRAIVQPFSPPAGTADAA